MHSLLGNVHDVISAPPATKALRAKRYEGLMVPGWVKLPLARNCHMKRNADRCLVH